MDDQWKQHIESIELSALDISNLTFTTPGAFTNIQYAYTSSVQTQIHPPSIVSLIRDTEPHERALFTVSTLASQQTPLNVESSNNSSVISGKHKVIVPRRNTAVRAVLGGEGMTELRDALRNAKDKGDVNVEVLLDGAEKLANFYYAVFDTGANLLCALNTYNSPIPNAISRISALRQHLHELEDNIALFEALVLEQRQQLDAQRNSDNNIIDDSADITDVAVNEDVEIVTEQELKQLEEEIRELELKKEHLEMANKLRDKTMNSHILKGKG